MNTIANNSEKKCKTATPPSFSSMQNTDKAFEAGSYNRKKNMKRKPFMRGRIYEIQ